MIDARYFANMAFNLTTDTAYWTSSPSANRSDASYAFHVSFGSGRVEDGLKSSARPVLLVRGNAAQDINLEDMKVCNANIAPTRPDSRYTVGTGEITDKTTGLIWQQCVLGLSGAACSVGVPSLLTQAEAQLAPVTAASAATPWRLPSKNELASLVERKCDSRAINRTVFPATPDFVWTSTPNVFITTAAWMVNFYSGFVSYANAASLMNVRLVRSSPAAI
jgi:hypothetical protein